MKKNLSIVLFSILFAGMIFAAKAKDTSTESFGTDIGITDSDCKNYAKNHEKISKDIEKYSNDLENGKTTTNSYEDLNKILEKNGISGPDQYLKISGIINAYAIVKYEKELESDRLTAAIMKKAETSPVSTYKATIGENDYENVKKNYKALAVAMGDENPEPEKKKDTTFGDVIGDSIGGKKGDILGKGVDSLLKKKGKSEKIVDHLDDE